jgi:thiamine pyrophosphate-dependent acetolactate synthase large subunit-like protein
MTSVTPRRSCAAEILRQISAAAVPVVFGLPGVHNLPFWQGDGDGMPPSLGVRHEQAAVYAADGLARATGGVGVALVTTGPGAANAVGAFGEAAASGSPVLLIATEISTRLARPGTVRGALHESRDQAALFAPLAKRVFAPRTAAAAADAVAQGLALAAESPRGPVYVDVPTDLLSASVDTYGPVRGGRREPHPAQLQRAARAIDAAERVVVWLGAGVVQADAVAEARALAEHVGAPVVTTYGARGLLGRNHPLGVGYPPHEPEVAALIGEADLLLAAGTDFDGMNTRNWKMPFPPALVEINVDAAELGKNYAADVSVLGDARPALAALLALTAPRESAPARRTVAQLRAAVRQRLEAETSGTGVAELLSAVEETAAVHDAILVDMAIAGYWIGGYAELPRARQLQYPVGWGTLGYALPAAVGPAAGGLRTLAVCGDGGLLLGVGELATIVQHQLPVTVLVVDNGGYGMLAFDQDAAGVSRRGVDLVSPDLPQLATAFGMPAETVGAPGAELAGALQRAAAAPGPRMIVLHHHMPPPRSTSARWFEPVHGEPEHDRRPAVAG